MHTRKRDMTSEVKKPGRKPKEMSLDGFQKKRQLQEKPSEKSGTGLRHFSMMVCQKVQEKGATTYGEVADMLIGELKKDEEDKNIRRRVYDALNVLMAMNIITKDKKQIRWLGLPSNSNHEVVRLENEKKELVDKVNKKKIHLQELLLQEISFKNLINRNAKLESESKVDLKSCIQLPFILVNTHSETKINCEMLEDRSQYYFEFDTVFEIHDDIEVLRRMGLNRCSPSQVRELIPMEFHKYLPPNMQKDDGSSPTEVLLSYDPQSLPSSSSPVSSPLSGPNDFLESNNSESSPPSSPGSE